MPTLKKKNDMDELKNAITAPETSEGYEDDDEPAYTKDDLIPTGSTHLNLACSNNPFGGFRKGRIVNIIGDSDTAKTYECLTTVAEVANDPRFKDYSLYLDDIEEGLSINIKKCFGGVAASRIDPKKYHSNTIEDWFANQMRAIREGKPFIYITDSFDALDSIDAQKRGEAIIKQSMKKNKENSPEDSDDKEEKEKGSYKTEKAKMLKQIFRTLKSDITKTESLFLIISHTMVDLRPMARGKKTRACGDTLKFFSTHEIWLNRIKKLTEKDLEIGNLIQAKFGKNRLTGKKRMAVFPVYTDYGVDDIVSCLNFLIDSGRITREKNTFTCKEFDFSGSKAGMISHIENNNLEREMKLVMWDEWKKIEDSVKLNRKPRWN